MNPYGVDTSESNTQGPVCSLEILYESMPATSGCEHCEKKNGEEGKNWCCREQSPSMYYVEFLHVYSAVQEWGYQKRKDLILRAIRNYLDNSINKGCIFYDKHCLVYEKRPLVCRLYGVIPKESWKMRWDHLKERQKEKFEAKPQCDLVTSEEEVTIEMESKWLQHALGCEKRIGVAPDRIHDLAGGSYRTFHDHLLLELFDESVLEFLTTIRLHDPSQADIDSTVKELEKLI
jgi:Fe-S-cluster containining protein